MLLTQVASSEECNREISLVSDITRILQPFCCVFVTVTYGPRLSTVAMLTASTLVRVGRGTAPVITLLAVPVTNEKVLM